MIVAGLHQVASIAFERMVYSLAEGTLLTVFVAFALRLLPARASQTRFTIWFSTLSGIVLVTVLGLRGASAGHGANSGSLFTLPVSIAVAAFLVWAALALAGLLRIVIGLFQLRHLRYRCRPVASEELPENARELIQQFRRIRGVQILESIDSHSPRAVGFFKPAIILPAWLIQERQGDELDHVLLHELAHLYRRDDWTNLFQQLVKAVFFFHPAIWWMEREISLSREQACDDVALEQTTNAHDYARSLALVAEKSFVRRQLDLAQAVIGRAHQLTQRVTRILDPARPVNARAWKPAIPLVALAAAVCGFSASWTPDLVKVQDTAALRSASLSSATVSSATVAQTASTREAARSSDASESSPIIGVKAWPASLKVQPETSQSHALIRAKRPAIAREPKTLAARVAENHKPAGDVMKHSPMIMARYLPEPGLKPPDHSAASATSDVNQSGEEMVVLVATQQTIVAGPDGWHVEVSQVRWVVPAKVFHQHAPNKT